VRDINDVIREVVKRSGFPEDVVAQVVRSSVQDCREFMQDKKGYCIHFPRFGTWSYRVTVTKPYIERQRRYMAYWFYRLRIGKKNGNLRTIESANINIKNYETKIKNTLLIRKEFLEDYAFYFPLES
jgi:hypothetical protein